MSSNLEEESMAADPAPDPDGNEIRKEDSTVESSQEAEIKDSSETIVEERTTVVVTETTVEVSVSEVKTTGDAQFVEEKKSDPTEISLEDLTGGLDVERTGEEMEEGEMEGSDQDQEAETDPVGEVKASESTGEEELEGKNKSSVEGVQEKKHTGEEELEGSSEKNKSSVEGIQEKENTGEELEQKDQEGEIEGEIEDQDMESKSTGDVQEQEVLESSVQEKEVNGEELEKEVEEKKEEAIETQPQSDTEKVLEEAVEAPAVTAEKVLEEEVDPPAVTCEKVVEESVEVTTVTYEKVLEESVEVTAFMSEKVLEQPAEAPAGTCEKVLEEAVQAPAVTSVEEPVEAPAVASENVLEEAVESPAVTSVEESAEVPAVASENVLEEAAEAPAVTSVEEPAEAPAVASEKLLEEAVEPPAVTREKLLEESVEITAQVEPTNDPMEVDLNCANNAEIEGIEPESEGIWGDELAGEDSRNDELTVNDFIMVEAKEVGEGSAEVGPTFDEINTDIELGERTVEENHTETVSTNTETKEAVVYHRRDKHTTKPAQTGPDSSVTQTQTPTEEEVQEIPIKYSLPSIEKGDFVIYDLVWGKVKSHPWWPGLIISPSDASSLATKYQKRDAFLVAYFGDKTFAWCEESQLKPFFQNFSHFEKQASSDAFNNAVKSVLSEVSRRFDVGAICSCLDENLIVNEVYPKIENAGVKQGFNNCEVSKGEIVNYFNSEGILGFVKNLALEPFKGTEDRLGLAMVSSLIKSFDRSKGCSVSPKYQTFGGPLEDYVEPIKTEKLPKNTITDENNETYVTNNSLATPSNNTSTYTSVIFPNKNTSTVKDVIIDPPPKRKRGRPPKKKKEETDLDSQKPLSDLVHKKPASNLSNGSKSNNTKPERERNLLSWDDDSSASLPWKKQKPVTDFDFVDQESKSLTQSSGFGFKIGACISRAASRLTGSGSGSQPVMTMPKFDSMDFDLSSDDELALTPKEGGLYFPEEKKVRKRRLKKYHYSDPHEILAQLCFLATSPLKEYVFLGTVTAYFTDFRKYIVPDPETEQPSVPVETGTTVPDKVKLKRGRKRKVELAQPQNDQAIDNNQLQLQDSYWSDMILSGQTEDQNSWPKVYKRRTSLNPTGTDSKRALVLLAASNRPVIRVEEKRLGECNPTALLLNFSTRYGPVPAETDLVRIFSRYGALKGEEMEKEIEGSVSKVKVVFKRRADADMAFGSLRKENVFGPALISYRLVYLSEIEKKSAVGNGEHRADVDLPVQEENVEAMDTTGVISMDQSSAAQTETDQMIAEMSSEIPIDQTIMMQNENLDEAPIDQTGNVELPNEPSSVVQSEVQTVTEISNEPSIVVPNENGEEENQIDQARDRMEMYDQSHVQSGDEIHTDSLKTVQEEFVGEEGSINPLEASSEHAQIENEKQINLSESSIQAEIENESKNEEPINPSVENIQGESENEKPINASFENIQGENENKEEPINHPSVENVQDESENEEEPINGPSVENIQNESENEEEQTNDPAGDEGVDEMQIDEPNTEEEEGAVDPPSNEEGEVADEGRTEQGEIFGDEDEELSGETEQGEILSGEAEQGEIVSDEAEQGEIVSDE